MIELVNSVAGKIKVVAIIASLATLALVLSPAFSSLSFSGRSDSSLDANNLIEEEVIEPDTTVVENVSAEDLVACTAVNKRIGSILGAVDGKVDDKKLASDTLLAEYCARPPLIHEIGAADHAPMSLVAYACDASSGRIGTPALQDSLSDHKTIYCDGARKLIINETQTFLQSIEDFRTEYLPLFQAGFEETEDGTNVIDEDAMPYVNVTSIEIALDEATDSLEQTLVMVDENEYYSATKSFDNASKKFIAIFQQESD
jgi:hypothetical protein